MTRDFENMLYLLGAGARGISVSAEGMDMEKVREYAISQGVWPIVYKAAEKTADVKIWRGEFLHTLARSVARREFSLGIVKKIENAGIEYFMMKGAAVARFYAHPDCRVSSDTDIYIRPRDEKKVISILEENGYKIKKRKRNGHHLKAMHPVGGLFEAHVRMYSKPTEKIVLNGRVGYSKTYEKFSAYGQEYLTMNVNDALVYLTVHFIKHLVNNGCGIRQLLDVLMFMENNKDEIDFDRYNKLMADLHYYKLIEVIKSIGAVYFGFDYPVCHKDLMEKLLTDIENGGAFGYSADDRDNFYNMYCASRKRRSSFAHRMYMFFHSEKGNAGVLFPSRKEMAMRGYGYVKNPFLLPFAWMHRLFDIAVRRKNSRPEQNAAADRARGRMEMIRQLGMID